jgi:uncharacterized protein YqeY
MNIKDQLQEDLKDAMRAHDELRLSTIRMLKSAIQYFEIQKGGAGYEATDEDVIEVAGREVKKRRESIELYEKGGNQEAADKEKQEIEILQKYLPEQMSEEKVRELVKDAVAKSGATSPQDMGKVMGILMPQVKGKADGSLVSSIVKEALTS